MQSIDPINDFEDDEDAGEDEDEGDEIELEIPRLDEINLPQVEREHVRRPVHLYNPGRLPGLGNRVFLITGSGSRILF
jgi:hypothetical protein